MTLAAEPFSWSQPHGAEFNRISREKNLSFGSELAEESQDERKFDLWQIPQLQGATSPIAFHDKIYVVFRSETALLSNDDEPAQELPVYTLGGWYIDGRDPEDRFQIDFPLKHSQGQVPVRLVGDPEWRQLFVVLPDGQLQSFGSDYCERLWSVDLLPDRDQESFLVDVAIPIIFEHLIITSVLQSRTDGTHIVSHTAYDRRNARIVWQERETTSSLLERVVQPIPAVWNHQVILVTSDTAGSVQFRQLRTGLSVKQLSLQKSAGLVQQLTYQQERLLVLYEQESEAVTEDRKPDWGMQLWALGETLAAQQQPAEKPAANHTPELIRDWSLPAAEAVTTLLHAEQIYVLGSQGVLNRYSTAREQSQQEIDLSEQAMGRLIWADQKLFINSDSGKLFALDCRDAEAKPLFAIDCEAQLIGWPAVFKKRMYVQTRDRMIALGSFDNGDAIADLVIPFSDLAKDGESINPGSLQIVPAMAEIRPGWKQKFQLLLYNDRGAYLNMLDSTDVNWTWQGPGTFNPQLGELSLPRSETIMNEAGQIPDPLILKVNREGLTGQARIRILPAQELIKAGSEN